MRRALQIAFILKLEDAFYVLGDELAGRLRCLHLVKNGGRYIEINVGFAVLEADFQVPASRVVAEALDGL